MSEPRCITLVLCLLFGILNTGRFPIAYAQSIITPSSSLVIQGNPWGITFQEIIAPGFSLERVELLPGSIWQITARISILQTEAHIAVGYTPVLFISPPWVSIPSERSLVRSFILDADIWLTVPATPPMNPDSQQWPTTDTIDSFDLVYGVFSYERIPGRTSLSNDTQGVLDDTSAVSTSIHTHPTIADVWELQIQIPDIVFTVFHTGNQDVSTRTLTVGLAYIHSQDHNHDHLHTGIVRVDEPDNVSRLTRSFTAITSQRYSFIHQPSLQVFETFHIDNWMYIAVVTFALKDGVTIPQLEFNSSDSSVFGITPSVTASNVTTWHTLSCPNVDVTPTGCASDLTDTTMKFCSVQPIWKDSTKTEIIAYRIKLLIPTYGKQATAVDNLFLRLLIHAVEASEDQDPSGSALQTTHSFINIQTPLLASSIRCGGGVLQEQTLLDDSTDDSVQLALYAGTTLVPLNKNTDTPLLPDATFSPHVSSTASNLRARGIMDSLVTMSLVGDDATFSTPSIQKIEFSDILTVHVRDRNLYENLLLHTTGGTAYSVNSNDKKISISETFATACAALPSHCAIRELMRSQTVLLPSYVHVASSIEDDTIWANELFRDEATSPKIAQTFIENVYQVMSLNDRYRRVAWVATQYEWTNTEQAGVQDHTLIFASFKIV
jgi:hypothetical protein